MWLRIKVSFNAWYGPLTLAALFLLSGGQGFGQKRDQNQGVPKFTWDTSVALPAIAFGGHKFLGLSPAEDSAQLFFFYFRQASKQVLGIRVNVDDFSVLDTLMVADNFKEPPIDIELRDSLILMLFFDRIQLYDRFGNRRYTQALDNKFENFHRAGNRLFISKAYNYQNDSSLVVAELIFDGQENGIRELKLVYEAADFDFRPLGHLFGRWIAVGEDGLYLANPLDFKVKEFDLAGRYRKTYLLDAGIFNACAAHEMAVDSLYYAFPVPARKQAVLALSRYLKRHCYLEQIYAVNNYLLGIVNYGIETERALVWVDKSAGGLPQVDTLLLELFTDHWQLKNGNAYRNELFPLRVDLNREIKCFQRKCYTSLEFDFFPSGIWRQDQYQEAMMDHFNKKGMHYCLLRYSIMAQ